MTFICHHPSLPLHPRRGERERPSKHMVPHDFSHGPLWDDRLTLPLPRSSSQTHLWTMIHTYWAQFKKNISLSPIAYMYITCMHVLLCELSLPPSPSHIATRRKWDDDDGDDEWPQTLAFFPNLRDFFRLKNLSSQMAFLARRGSCVCVVPLMHENLADDPQKSCFYSNGRFRGITTTIRDFALLSTPHTHSNVCVSLNHDDDGSRWTWYLFLFSCCCCLPVPSLITSSEIELPEAVVYFLA